MSDATRSAKELGKVVEAFVLENRDAESATIEVTLQRGEKFTLRTTVTAVGGFIPVAETIETVEGEVV